MNHFLRWTCFFVIHRQPDCNKGSFHAISVWLHSLLWLITSCIMFTATHPCIKWHRLESECHCLCPRPNLYCWSLQHVYCLYTTEEAHLVMPSLPVSICAHQRDRASKIKTESKTLFYNSIISTVPSQHREAVRDCIYTVQVVLFNIIIIILFCGDGWMSINQTQRSFL